MRGDAFLGGWRGRTLIGKLMCMDTLHHPDTPYLLISLTDLEMVWRRLASPDKLNQIPDRLLEVRALDQTHGSLMALYTLVAVSAWLAESGACSHDG